MVLLPHTNTVILLEQYCGTITEPGLPVESPHELARQSEAKLKQAPQSEANVCRRRRRTKKPPLLIAQVTQ